MVDRLQIAKIVTIFSLIVFHAHQAFAQGHASQRNVVNSGTVGIMSGALGGTDLRIAADLANAFDDGYDLRVLGIIGKGSVRDIEDLVYLRGSNVAGNSLNFVNAQHFNIGADHPSQPLQGKLPGSRPAIRRWALTLL